MGKAPIPVELADLLQRAASHPQGWVILRDGCLESASTCLGLHPFVVEAARAWFASAEGRRFVEQAALRGAAGRCCTGAPPAAVSACYGRDSQEAQALIAAAERGPGGGAPPRFSAGGLASGKPDRRTPSASLRRSDGHERLRADDADELARAYGVHPYTVFRARGILERYPYREPAGSPAPAPRS